MNNKKLLILAFAISGFAALVYEVVWSRSLQLIFGSTVYAVSTILTTFLTGFTIGSYLFRNIADNSKNPEKLIGIIQTLLGIYGLLTIWLFKAITPIYLFLENPILEFGLLFLLLIIPTILFGAIWPLINKSYSTTEKLGKETGILYSFNSLGSFLGSLSAGFLLIPLFGVSNTSSLISIMLVAIGATLIMKSRRENGN